MTILRTPDERFQNPEEILTALRSVKPLK